MADKYERQAPGLTSPGIEAFPVAPSNSANLTHVTRALYVGSTGDVRLELVDGSEVTFRAMQAGMMYPLRVRKVFRGGTTADNLIGVC